MSAGLSGTELGIAGAAFGTVAAMGLGVIEIAKLVIGKAGKRNSASSPQLDRIEGRVRSLDELHSPKDQDGVPVWYIPRGFADALKEITKLLENCIRIQERTLEAVMEIKEKDHDAQRNY